MPSHTDFQFFGAFFRSGSFVVVAKTLSTFELGCACFCADKDLDSSSNLIEMGFRLPLTVFLTKLLT